MKIALPLEHSVISGHFGHAERFAIVPVQNNNPAQAELLVPPPHEPGVLPRWLQSLGVTHLICGGIGGGAIQLFNSMGITVMAGCTGVNPEEAISAFLSGRLSPTTIGTCEGHGHGHDEHSHGAGHSCGSGCGAH